MQSAVALFVKSCSKSPERRHDIARKIWASVNPAHFTVGTMGSEKTCGTIFRTCSSPKQLYGCALFLICDGSIIQNRRCDRRLRSDVHCLFAKVQPRVGILMLSDVRFCKVFITVQVLGFIQECSARGSAVATWQVYPLLWNRRKARCK